MVGSLRNLYSFIWAFVGAGKRGGKKEGATLHRQLLLQLPVHGCTFFYLPSIRPRSPPNKLIQPLAADADYSAATKVAQAALRNPGPNGYNRNAQFVGDVACRQNLVGVFHIFILDLDSHLSRMD